jgi:hypothetical protein
MNIEDLSESRTLQEQFVLEAAGELLKETIYKVLDYANSLSTELSRHYSGELENKQSLALRCCFFFLNQLGDRRLKGADILNGEEREEAFENIKNDFELVLRFIKQPDTMQSYFFKCDNDRIFQISVMVGLSFMGGNPAIERIVEDAEENRLKCFELLMVSLDEAREC